MRVLPVIALGTVVALALSGAAYAATKDGDEPPLPKPSEDDTCSTSADVGAATSEILADETVSAKGLRAAADVLRNWTTYCDEAAQQTGAASILLLEAKATSKEEYTPSGDLPPVVGYSWPVPPGYSGSKHTTGLHNDAGTVYWYANGDQWFYPDNVLLIPYFIPGGSKDISTEGYCEGCGE